MDSLQNSIKIEFWWRPFFLLLSISKLGPDFSNVTVQSIPNQTYIANHSYTSKKISLNFKFTERNFLTLFLTDWIKKFMILDEKLFEITHQLTEEVQQHQHQLLAQQYQRALQQYPPYK